MLGPAHQYFLESDNAYRRERVLATYKPAPPHTRARWTQRVRDAVRAHRNPVRGAARWATDGPLIRPTAVTSFDKYRATTPLHHR